MGHFDVDEVCRLIDEARRGKSEAFGQLVEACNEALIGRIRRRLWDRNDAEDIAQEAWAAMWEDIHTPVEEGGYDPARGTPLHVYVYERFGKFLIRRRWGRATGPVLGATDGAEGGPEPTDYREPRPEEAAQLAEMVELKLAAYSELLRLTFLCGGYPHQQLALAFSKLIYGTRSDRAVEGSPRRVDQEHGHEPMERLATSFWEAYEAASQITDPGTLEELGKHLQPVRLRLRLTVGELTRLDRASSKHFADMLQRVVAATCLSDYYARRKGGYTTAIPDWCDKVERRLRQVLGLSRDTSQEGVIEAVAGTGEHGEARPTVCNRCKLRHVPPCGGDQAARSHISQPDKNLGE